MASQVPTGYNPEASLLQGGTASIVPVQGGGGMEAGASLPPNYNPDVSLLNTGQNAPIVAVKGGANGDTGTLPVYDGYAIEYYVPPSPSTPLKEPAVPDKTAKQAAMTTYESSMLPKLNQVDNFDFTPKPYKSENDDNPTYKRICPTPKGGRKLPNNFFQKVRRRILRIETESPTIWIIHNLNGNLSRYIQYLNLIPKVPPPPPPKNAPPPPPPPPEELRTILPNHYVIFTGNFFSSEEKNKNAQLYYMFLKQKQRNPDSFFYLVSLTEDFVLASCKLLNDAYSLDTLKDPKDRPVYPFFEPDIVVFQKQHILLTNGPMPIKQVSSTDSTLNVQLSNLLERPDPTGIYKDVIIIPTPGIPEDRISGNKSSAPPDKKYFKIDIGERKVIDFPDDKKTVTCPKDEACEGFRGGYKLLDLTDDYTLPASGIYVIRKNPENLSFFASTAPKPKALEGPPKVPEGPPKVPEGPPKVPEGSPKVPEGPPKVPEGPPKVPQVLPKRPEEPPVVLKKPKQDTPFVADSTATTSDETMIEVNTKQYRLRNPSKQVSADWLKGKFTQNEVDFLNAMQFTPTLLGDAFGKSYWKQRLNDFLHSVVMSNCYVDTTLLTNIECSNAQEFIKKVYVQLFNRSLEQMYTEMGVPKPKLLAELIDEVTKLKQLGSIKGLSEISQFQFTGDLLERFHKIYYDSKKGEYYYDLVELTDATREFLKTLKFYRVEDLDPEAITKKILERMSIPLPKGGPAPTGPATTGPPKGGPPPPPPPPTNTYTLDQIKAYDPIPLTFFNNFFVSDDGLCFPRAVLKALQPTPISDSKTRRDVPYIYDPDEATSIAFLKEIIQYIRAHKAEIKIKKFNESGAIIEVPVQDYFEEKYKQKGSEPVDSSAPVNGRIRVGTVYKKLTLDQYLTILETETDPLVRPFAEVNDAGIGIAAAKLKDIVIMIYNEGPGGYHYNSVFNEQAASAPQPLSKFVFLEFKDGNHYNTLHVAPGQTWPKPTAGGQIEEAIAALDEMGVLDMGEILEDIPRRVYRKKTRKAKKLSSKKPQKQTRKHK